MPTNHDAVGALPVGSEAVKQTLRDLLVKRMAYCLASDESAQDLVAVDPASGATILVLIQNGRVYALDPLDETTAHDGTTVLVSSDGKRYHLDDLEVPYAVLDKDLTAPPDSPEAASGDSYLLVEPGTGAWASLGPLVTLTSRGWENVSLPIGRMIYVEDEDAYYHRDANGDIVAGLGIGSIAAASLYPSHFLRGGDLVSFIVENQTTDTPPGSPSEGDAYIAAASSTGAWSGWGGSVVRYENGAWRRYEPGLGWRGYDKTLNVPIAFDGTNWVSAGGAWRTIARQFTSGTGSTSSSGSANWDGASVPTTSNGRLIDNVTIVRQASAAEKLQRFTYEADMAGGASANTLGSSSILFMGIALYRGNEENAIAHAFLSTPSAAVVISSTGVVVSRPGHVSASFVVPAVDAAEHTYRIAVISRPNSNPLTNVVASSLSRRTFMLEEAG